MGRDLRFIPKGTGLVEITDRCIQRRFLLRPSPAVNATLVGALARAAKRHGVGIVAYCFLSNHFHLLIVCHEEWRQAAFLRDFKSKAAKEIQRLHDWTGPVFPHRFKPIPVSDEPEAQQARLRYVLEQGVKEGLVASPLHWPGANSTRSLLTDRPARGRWVDRTGQWRARQRGEDAGDRLFTTEEAIELLPLPVWQDLDPTERQHNVRTLIRDIERQAKERLQTTGRPVVGRREILRQHPHGSPGPAKRSPAVRFHAATKRVRLQLTRAYYAFLDSYRTATEALCAGRLDEAHFPAGCNPPPVPRPLLEPG